MKFHEVQPAKLNDCGGCDATLRRFLRLVQESQSRFCLVSSSRRILVGSKCHRVGASLVKFTIRDLLLVTVIVTLSVGWWADRSRLAAELQLRYEQDMALFGNV